jgi:hypothetical protein
MIEPENGSSNFLRNVDELPIKHAVENANTTFLPFNSINKSFEMESSIV